MANVKRLAWVLVGVAIGFALSTASAVRAEPREGEPNRIVAHPTLSQLPGLIFVSDEKTHSCWLAAEVKDKGFSGLATAPPDACR
jgi:hypothetical protein